MCNPKEKVATPLRHGDVGDKCVLLTVGQIHGQWHDIRRFITNESLTPAETRECLQHTSMWTINNGFADEKIDSMVLT
jgi:hypothetical protein